MSVLFVLVISVATGFQQSQSFFAPRHSVVRKPPTEPIHRPTTLFDNTDSGNKIEEEPSSHARRYIMQCCVSSSLLLALLLQQPVYADDGVSKPYAPIENLIPATRVRVYIDELVDIAREIKNSGRQEDIQKLSKLLCEKNQSFISDQEEVRARRYLELPTWNEWSKSRQRETETAFLGQKREISPIAQLAEKIQSSGTRGQFLRLRQRQLSLEKANNMRAAFNAYTNNLVYGESYTLNVGKEEKSRMIRNDGLPDVTSVVRSDLDLRDLYRNQVLDYMDDSRAELEYQLSLDTFDVSDLLDLLKGAQSSCNEWFSLVPGKDATAALDVVLEEKARQ